MYINDIQKQLEFLEETIKTTKKQLKHYPPGELLCFKNGKYIKCFLREGTTMKYLSKHDKELTKKFANKKYREACLYDYKQEKELLSEFLEKTNSLEERAMHLLDQSSNYNKIITESITKDEWATEPFDSNPYCPEHLIHKTLCNIQVRSKSEAIIANSLFTNHIPFRYESPLEINNLTIYPDFTIKNPKTQEFTYWEHFGLMDENEYREKALRKIDLYCQNDIIPDVNLILSYETQSHPLDSSWVQQLIARNFM